MGKPAPSPSSEPAPPPCRRPQAFKQGDPRRLYYGIDSYGNVCGASNTWNGVEGPDLTERKRVLFLDPIEVRYSWEGLVGTPCPSAV